MTILIAAGYFSSEILNFFIFFTFDQLLLPLLVLFASLFSISKLNITFHTLETPWPGHPEMIPAIQFEFDLKYFQEKYHHFVANLGKRTENLINFITNSTQIINPIRCTVM